MNCINNTMSTLWPGEIVVLNTTTQVASRPVDERRSPKSCVVVMVVDQIPVGKSGRIACRCLADAKVLVA